MCAAPAMVSIGDDGVLNREVSQTLSDVWIDRDLSWLDFNDRVLAEALDERTPLLERAKFLAIFSANLDEFFMKRISVLRKGSTPERTQLRAAIRERLLRSLEKQARCFRQVLVPELGKHGIHFETGGMLGYSAKTEAIRSCSRAIRRMEIPAIGQSWSARTRP
jgi:polyphosphate kinase